MAEFDFKTMLINSVLIGLFVVALVSFIYQYQVDNNASETLLDDQLFNNTFINLSSSLTDLQSESLNQSTNQDESAPIAIFDFLSESIVGSVRVFKGTYSLIYNLTFGLIITKLGIDPMVLYALGSIIIIIAIFLAWRTLKRG